MTDEEIISFKKEYKSIVYLRSMLKNNGLYLAKLHAWDKNDSHKKAIEKGLLIRDQIRDKIKNKLSGKTYEEWKAFSYKLSKLQNRLRKSIEIRKQISELQFKTK